MPVSSAPNMLPMHALTLMVQCGAVGGIMETLFHLCANCGNHERSARISLITFVLSACMVWSVSTRQPTNMQAGQMHFAR